MEVPLPQQLCVLFSILEFLGIRYPAGNYFISHLCTRKIIFPAMLGGDIGFFRRVQSLGMAPVITVITLGAWGEVAFQYREAIPAQRLPKINQNSYWPSRISFKGRVGGWSIGPAGGQLYFSFMLHQTLIGQAFHPGILCIDTNHGVFQMLTPFGSR